MRPAEQVEQVRQLALEGRNACEIARLTGIPRSTLREWIHPRKLRVFMDSRYPGIIAEVLEAMRVVMPTSIASDQPHPRHNVVEWQEAIVDREPEAFVRGLLHSDGCRVMNRIVVNGKDYAYPRYFFSQVSKDIQDIFCRALDRLGIHYTFSRRGLDVSIARRESVARLDSFVGKKS